MPAFGVYSEVSQLKKVIVHRPVSGHKYSNRAALKSLDSEDVQRVGRMRDEHDDFVNMLREQDVEILYLENLLEQALDYPDARDWLLDRRLEPEHLGPSLSHDFRAWLDEVPSKILVEILTNGITFAQLPFKHDDQIASVLEPSAFVLPPLPNQMFTQDASSWIYNGVSLNPFGLTARQGESDNVAAIYHFHPAFEESHFKIWWGLDKDTHRNVSLQGGDVMVLGQGKVAIAMGKHTTSRAIIELASALIDRAEVEEVIIVKIPPRFAQSRLDFTFNICGPDVATVCRPVADAITCYSVHKSNRTNRLVTEQLPQHLLDVMRRALRIKKLHSIDIDGCNGRAFDGNNPNASVLTIKPGVIASYAGETEINTLLTAAGMNVLPIEANELSHSGGGPRRLICAASRGPALD